MDKNEIIASAVKFVLEAPGNFITSEDALDPDYVGMKIFEEPVLAFGLADDELYMKFKSPDIIGSNFLTPTEWLPGARTVISFFLPYTDRIKCANAADKEWPAEEWLHGRYEGQLLVKALAVHLQELLAGSGYEALVPTLDDRFDTGNDINEFASNWSERHVAFACGLGTFGLSGGLITRKGLCGRFGSVLTGLALPGDPREYSDPHEYCSICGACIKRCPVAAISLTYGKKSQLCSDFLDIVAERHKPRYGCGKCQVKVPCESGIPKKRKI